VSTLFTRESSTFLITLRILFSLLNIFLLPDPQYVIPIVGMLLGNCINGVSLSLNSILTALVESTREVELLLSFGANSYEATARLFREAVRTGSMPQLNSMAIIGIISIPGDFPSGVFQIRCSLEI
jgi:putative ABC transport system permease protein